MDIGPYSASLPVKITACLGEVKKYSLSNKTAIFLNVLIFYYTLQVLILSAPCTVWLTKSAFNTAYVPISDYSI